MHGESATNIGASRLGRDSRSAHERECLHRACRHNVKHGEEFCVIWATAIASRGRVNCHRAHVPCTMCCESIVAILTARVNDSECAAGDDGYTVVMSWMQGAFEGRTSAPFHCCLWVSNALHCRAGESCLAVQSVWNFLKNCRFCNNAMLVKFFIRKKGGSMHT